MRSPRLSTFAKWFGVVLSLLLLCLWLASGWCDKHWKFRSATRTTYIRIEYGRFGIFTFQNSLPDPQTIPGFDLSNVDFRQRWHLNLDFDLQTSLYKDFAIPLWFPLLLVSLPTLTLSYREHRKSREGLCEYCDHDRRGINPSAPCPECGKPNAKRRSRTTRQRIVVCTFAVIFIALVGLWVDASVNTHFLWSKTQGTVFSDSIRLERGGIVIEHLPETGNAAAFYVNREILDFFSAYVYGPEFIWWVHWVYSAGEWIIVFPLWIPAALTAIPLIYVWRGAPLFRRVRPNHCPSCSYDRTGLPPQSPCPECNAAPEPDQERSRLRDLLPLRLLRKRPREVVLVLSLILWLGSTWYALGMGRGNRVVSICYGSINTFPSRQSLVETQFGIERISNASHLNLLYHLKSLQWWIYSQDIGASNWQLRIPLWPLVLLSLSYCAIKWAGVREQNRFPIDLSRPI